MWQSHAEIEDYSLRARPLCTIAISDIHSCIYEAHVSPALDEHYAVM